MKSLGQEHISWNVTLNQAITVVGSPLSMKLQHVRDHREKKKGKEMNDKSFLRNANLLQPSDLYIQNHISHYEEQYAKESFYEAEMNP